MMQKRTPALSAYIYLLLVPVITAAAGFGIGHVSYKIYLPVWLVNVVLMTLAAWTTGLSVIKNRDAEKSQLAVFAFFLVIPWILISMFAGLGPPPGTAMEWTATSTEQQVRYFMLVISGVFIVLGFVGLRDRLKDTGERFYSVVGLALLLIAIPLFMLNMVYWGFYLTERFNQQIKQAAATLPEWSSPVREQFRVISAVEVALTYISTFAFALSFRKAGWLGRRASQVYIFFSLLASAIILLSVFLGEPFETAGYAVSIPAFPFIMPYYMGVNLLRGACRNSREL